MCAATDANMRYPRRYAIVPGSAKSLFLIGNVCAAIGLNSCSCASAKKEGNNESKTPGGGTLVGGNSPGIKSSVAGDRMGAGVEVFEVNLSFVITGAFGAAAGIEASQSSNVSQSSSAT